MPKQSLQQARQHEFKLCAEDFWYYAQFVKTYDEENEKIRPYPLDYDYLYKVQSELEEYQKIIMLKSRRLLMTWHGMVRQHWRAKFAGTGAVEGKEVYRGAVMTIGEVEGEELIDRISFIEKHLPDWLQKKNPLIVDNNMLLKWECGGAVRGFPLKRSGPRSFGFTEVFFDEMAFQEAVRGVYTGMAPTLGAKGKMIAVSTPNGRANLFYDIWSNKNKKYTDIHRIDLDFDLHPEHGQKWLKGLIASMDDRMISREIYKSFATPAGDPVWPEYNQKAHKADNTEVLNDRVMYLGWDFGFHYPAALFMQRNNRDQWVGYREVLGADISFDKFTQQVKEVAESLYDRRVVREIHCCPPDGRNKYRSRSRSGAVNDVGEIKQTFKLQSSQIKFGPNEVGTRDNEGPRLKETRKIWHIRADHEAGAYFDESMVMLHEGCQAGYCYPEKGGEQPDKSSEHCHIQDALQAVIVAFNRMNKKPQNQYEIKQTMRHNKKQRRSRWKIGIPQRPK